MKALRVVFPAPRQVALEEFELAAPGPGQVLVKTEQTLISTGTELTALTGDFPPRSVWANYVRYPWYPGYSHVGRVLAAGPPTGGQSPGGRGGGGGSSGPGESDQGSAAPGALVLSHAPHASHALVPREHVRVLPPGVGAAEATFGVLAATVLNGVRRARIALGEAVAIAGAGLLGQLCAQVVRLSGGFPVISIDLAAGRLQLASRLRAAGPTHTLCMPVAEARPEVLRLTRGRGADAAFEVTGHPAVVAPLLRLLRREGRAILLGSPRGPSQIDLHDEVHTLGLHVIGAHASTHPSHETFLTPWTRERNVELFLALLQAGHLDVRSLITHQYPGTAAPEAFALLLEDRTQAVGVILDWTSLP